MALWIIFPSIAAALFGAVVLVTALGLDHHRSASTSMAFSERQAWWRLWWPLFAGFLAVAFLSGWALQEPNPADEWIAFEVWGLSGAVAVMVVRACLRAFRSIGAANHANTPIATVGLLRCRTVVSESFTRAASPEVMAAALAHEAAHARQHDPIRIWVAQFAADLQWPMPRARLRFKRWVLALEMRRDDEAVTAGAQATALAEGILLAARLQSGRHTAPSANITGSGEDLAFRVRRLLSTAREFDTEPERRSRIIIAWCCIALSAAAWLGILYGDAVLLLLPGVER